MEELRKRSPLWYYLPLFLMIAGGAIAYFKIKKDDARKARNCLILGVILTVPLGIYFALALTSSTDYPFHIMTDGRMEPRLNLYDLLIIKDGSTFEKVKVGDIIVFNRPEFHDRVMVERVVDIRVTTERILITKAESNPSSIPGIIYPITKKDYIGQVVYVIPKIGYVMKLLSPPVNYIIGSVIVSIPFVQHIRYRKSTVSLDRPSAI